MEILTDIRRTVLRIFNRGTNASFTFTAPADKKYFYHYLRAYMTEFNFEDIYICNLPVIIFRDGESKDTYRDVVFNKENIFRNKISLANIIVAHIELLSSDVNRDTVEVVINWTQMFEDAKGPDEISVELDKEIFDESKALYGCDTQEFDDHYKKSISKLESKRDESFKLANYDAFGIKSWNGNVMKLSNFI